MAIRRLRFHQTLQARFLLALVLIGILPLGLTGLGVVALDHQALVERSSSELVALAQGFSSQVDGHVADLLNDTHGIAALPELVTMEPDRQEGILQELFHQFHAYALLATFDLNGDTIVSCHPGELPSVGALESFQAATQFRRQAWEIGPAPSTGRAALLIYTPIRDADRRVVGVLGAVVNLEDLSAALERVPVSDGRRAFVLDAAGRVLLHPDPDVVQERRDYSWLGVPTGARSAGPGIISYALEGEPLIAGYAPVPSVGWTAIVERPEADALAPAARSGQIALASLGASALLAGAAAFLLARSLTRPVRELVLAARALGRGDMSAPLPPPALSGELGGLVETFREMRDRLAARTQERERAAEAVERERREKAALLNSAAEGIYGLDLEGRCTFVNRAATQMLGYESADVLGRKMHTLVHHSRADGTVWPEQECPAQFALRSGRFYRATDDVMWRRDGSALSVEYSISPVVQAGRTVGAVVTFTDITERKRAEEALRFLALASEQVAVSLDYDVTLQALAHVAVPFLADYCVVDVVEQDGQVRRAAVGHRDPAMEGLVRRHATDAARDDHPVVRALRTAAPALIPEVTGAVLAAVAADGEHLRALRQLGPRSAMVVPLLARGQAFGVITFVSTEQGRRYGATDLTLAEEFAHRAALALNHARLYRQSQDAVRMRDEFLSAAAHELKTPLTSLRLSAQLASRRLGRAEQTDPALVNRTLRTIDEQADKLSRLVAQLLDVSRIQAGRLVPELQPTDLVRLVNTVVAEARSRSNRHRISVAGPRRLVALLDPLRFEQVVTNLVDNAIKYSPDGGPVDVEIAMPDRSSVRISVTDRGIGIPGEHRPYIFDRFYQANVHAHFGGMGLGLYISRQIVELHEGELWAEFPPEGGTRLVVRLPRRSGVAQAPGQGQVGLD